jgi:hypothetical protein
VTHSLDEFARAVDPNSTDEWPLVSVAKSYQALTATSLLAGESAGGAAVDAMKNAKDAANRWVSDGWEYVSQLNSGVSTRRQQNRRPRAVRDVAGCWTAAAGGADLQSTDVCGT